VRLARDEIERMQGICADRQVLKIGLVDEWCSVLLCGAVRSCVLQCVAVCCSVLQSYVRLARGRDIRWMQGICADQQVLG